MTSPVQFYEEPTGGIFDLLREPVPYGPMTEQASRISDALNAMWERCKVPQDFGELETTVHRMAALSPENCGVNPDGSVNDIDRSPSPYWRNHGAGHLG
jgi:hypothetical protein